MLAAQSVDRENAGLHSQILSLRRRLASTKDIPESVQAVLEATLPDLIASSASSDSFNDEFLSRHTSSPEHVLAGARGVLEIKRSTDPLPSDTAEAVSFVLDKLVADGVPPHVDALLDAVSLLKEAGASTEQITAFEQEAKGRVPLATVFEPVEEKKKRRDEVMQAFGEEIKA